MIIIINIAVIINAVITFYEHKYPLYQQDYGPTLDIRKKASPPLLNW